MNRYSHDRSIPNSHDDDYINLHTQVEFLQVCIWCLIRHPSTPTHEMGCGLRRGRSRRRRLFSGGAIKCIPNYLS